MRETGQWHLVLNIETAGQDNLSDNLVGQLVANKSFLAETASAPPV